MHNSHTFSFIMAAAGQFLLGILTSPSCIPLIISAAALFSKIAEKHEHNHKINQPISR